jgi:hypothetical protein
MMYALGRELEYFDMPQVRADRARRRGSGGLSVLGDRAGIVNSDAFRMQAVRVTEAQARAGAARHRRQKTRGSSVHVSYEEASFPPHVLKGAGVSVGLPLLDAMIPAATALAQTAAAPKLRAGFFYIPHGAIMWNTAHGAEMDHWTPSGAGADFRLSPILEPLESYKHYVTSFANLENKASAELGAHARIRRPG